MPDIQAEIPPVTRKAVKTVNANWVTPTHALRKEITIYSWEGGECNLQTT